MNDSFEIGPWKKGKRKPEDWPDAPEDRIIRQYLEQEHKAGIMRIWPAPDDWPEDPEDRIIAEYLTMEHKNGIIRVYVPQDKKKGGRPRGTFQSQALPYDMTLTELIPHLIKWKEAKERKDGSYKKLLRDPFGTGFDVPRSTADDWLKRYEKDIKK